MMGTVFWLACGLVGYVLARKSYILEKKHIRTQYYRDFDQTKYDLKVSDLFVAAFSSLTGPILLMTGLLVFAAFKLQDLGLTEHAINNFFNRKVVFPKLPNVTIRLGSDTNKNQVEYKKEKEEF